MTKQIIYLYALDVSKPFLLIKVKDKSTAFMKIALEVYIYKTILKISKFQATRANDCFGAKSLWIF